MDRLNFLNEHLRHTLTPRLLATFYQAGASKSLELIILIDVVHVNRKTRSRQLTEQITTCEDEIALLADYLSSSLSPRVLITFEAHLEDCRDCAAFLWTYKKTIEVTRSFLEVQPFTSGATK